jgi:hypothetical protein
MSIKHVRIAAAAFWLVVHLAFYEQTGMQPFLHHQPDLAAHEILAPYEPEQIVEAPSGTDIAYDVGVPNESLAAITAEAPV